MLEQYGERRDYTSNNQVIIKKNVDCWYSWEISSLINKKKERVPKYLFESPHKAMHVLNWLLKDKLIKY